MLVETAILLPLIIIITFGVIEFSSAYQASSTAASATRSAARTASAQAMLPNYATNAAAAATTALRQIPADEPVELWIYKANLQGYPGADGNTSFTTCAANCIKYPWDSAQRKFDTTLATGGGWPSTAQNACDAGTGWDSVGIYIKLDHKFITKLFGTTVTLTDKAVFRLEPAPTNLCNPTP